MPVRDRDPFTDRTLRLDARVNPFVAQLAEAQKSGSLPVAHGPELKNVRGTWRERVAKFYDRETPFEKLVVEIGCHTGVTLRAMAAEHPDTAFIGIDITFKRVVTAAERAVQAGLKNVYTVLANAAPLDMLFADRELDLCVIFFPDPWVRKKKQAKNRLLTEAFAAKLAGRLKDQGVLWLKTDQEPYFKAAALNIDLAGLVRLPPDELAPFGRDYTSTFEQRFAMQNVPTHGARWRVCYN